MFVKYKWSEILYQKAETVRLVWKIKAIYILHLKITLRQNNETNKKHLKEAIEFMCPFKLLIKKKLITHELCPFSSAVVIFVVVNLKFSN